MRATVPRPPGIHVSELLGAVYCCLQRRWLTLVWLCFLWHWLWLVWTCHLIQVLGHCCNGILEPFITAVAARVVMSRRTGMRMIFLVLPCSFRASSSRVHLCELTRAIHLTGAPLLPPTHLVGSSRTNTEQLWQWAPGTSPSFYCHWSRDGQLRDALDRMCCWALSKSGNLMPWMLVIPGFPFVSPARFLGVPPSL